jgi:hypothetical protein
VKICLVFVVLVPAVAIAGCGRGGARDPGVLAQTASPDATFDSTKAGEITGTVTLDGAAPAEGAIDMSSEPACAKGGAAVGSAREVLTGENGALANVVVFVKAGLKTYRFDLPTKPAILEQRGCMYEPRVVALMTNQPLEIRNDDATIHNVHATPKANDGWNKAQRAGSAALRVSFSRPELAIPLMCNVHPWMRAFVFVFAHPYYAVTTTEGKFELSKLPPGIYTIGAWHEKYGEQEQTVTVKALEAKSIAFHFKVHNPLGD